MVRMSRRAADFMREKGYRTIIVSLEAGCSCGGAPVTELKVDLKTKNVREADGYRYIDAGGFHLLVDRRFNCRPKISIYLNERGIGSILDIEGIEL